MRSDDVQPDGFAIFSDNGQMIGNATIFDRKRVEAKMVWGYRDVDPSDAEIAEWQAITQTFAEEEARRLRLVDE